jgi:hypothetical protein
MSNWIKLDASRLSEFGEETRVVRGVATRVLPSPYDIPNAVRVRSDESSGRSLIEFRYLNEEPSERVSAAPGIWFQVGQKTKRLYCIEIDVAAARSRGNVVTRIPLPKLIGLALDQIAPDKVSSDRGGNLSIARHALSANKEVFAELASAGLGAE